MINLSVSVDMITKKVRYLTKKDIVYISATFENDKATRDFVRKIYVQFKCKESSVVIEDNSLTDYTEYFQKSNFFVSEHGIIALNVHDDDIMSVISNWCFYEIKASIYLLDDSIDCGDFSSNNRTSHNVSEKDFLSLLEEHSIISIHQELDYTVNLCCKKRAFQLAWDILKKEDFKLL